MGLDTLQIRINNELVKKLDELVKSGLYHNRSDAIRDAVRRLILNDMIGVVKDNSNSLKQIKKTRKKLSKKINLEEINNLAD